MKIGIHKVKLVGAGISPDKSGNIQPFMRFENPEGETFTWFGNLKGGTPEKTEKAKAFAVKRLITCGFTGKNWDDLSNGLEAFEPKELKLKLVEETYSSNAGETKTKTAIQWLLEDTGDASSKSKMSAAEISTKLNDKALFAATRADMGVKATKKTDEIPF
jgi:hypothetical protein